MGHNEQKNDSKETIQLRKILESDIDKKFPWNDDVLKREEYSINLTKLIRTLSQPYVMGIDSPYGGGKFFFIKRWQVSLNEEFQTVYFNAWESDFSKDPLAAFISVLQRQLSEESVGKDIAENVKTIAKIAAPAIAKHAANYIFGKGAVKAFKETGGSIALEITQQFFSQQLEEQKMQNLH